MESPFDHLFKDFESKSSKKNTKGKKGWLLSKQYLQPLEEPDDVDKESDIDPSVKNKLRCICRSAFYGMKEGLLTGIFLGGFYGVLKFLNGSSSAFFGSNGGGENYNNERGEVSERYYGGGVRKERKSPGRNRRADTRAHPSIGRKQSGSRSGSISYQEKLSSYRTIEETIYGYSKETKPQNYASKRFRNIDLSYSKLPVRTDKYLGSSSPRVEDKKKYGFGRTSEKVEIVGYAFIKTTGAFETESTSGKSIEYGSPRQSKSELEKKEKEEEEEEEEQEPYPQKNKSSVESSATFLSRRTSDSLKSPEKSSYTVREMSAKSFKSKESGLSEKHDRSAKSLKSKESVLIAKHEKSAKSLRIGESLLTAKQEKSVASVKSGSPSVIDDSVPPTRVGSEREPRESISKGLQKAFSSLKGAASKNKSKQSVINEMDEERQKPSRITIVSPKYTSRDSSQVRSAEQSSSVLIKSLEPDQSDISTRPTKELSQDSRLRSKESSKTSKGVSKHSVRSSIIVESDPSTPDASVKSSRATVRTSERSKSRLNDSTVSGFRDHENLYPSVHAPSYLVNADEVSNGYGSPSLLTSQEQQSEHDTIHSKYSESSFSPDIEGSKGELDDVGFTGSNISEFQMRSPFRTFSPSLSTTQTDQIRTPENSAWSFSAIHDSGTIHAEESASVVPEFKDESNFTLKTTKQSRSVIFSESGRSIPHTERSNLSGLPSVQPSEKSFLLSEQVSGKSPLASSFDKSLLSSEQVSGKSHVASSYDKSLLSSEQLSAKPHVASSYDKSLLSSEQVSGKSHVASSYDKSLLSSEQVSGKSHVADEYPSEKSLLSNERLTTDRSRVSSDQYSQRLQVRSHESSKKSYPGGMAKSNSSLIQDVGPDVSRSSMAKGAPVASRAHKASPDQEEPTGFGVLSSVSDNTIVLCACNCAIVLGILCTVISTTKASLKI